MDDRDGMDINMTIAYLSGKRLHGFIVSIAIAALGYFVFMLWGGWGDVLSAFGSVGWRGVIVALFLSLVNYGLRFLRWQMYLWALGYSVPYVPSAVIYLAGFSLTTTPGKAGEMLRGIFLKSNGIPYLHSTAAFLSERLSDLSGVVLLSLLGLTLFTQGGTLIAVSVGLVGLGVLVLSRAHLLEAISERLAQRSGRIARLGYHLLTLLIEARQCHRLPLLVMATILSVAAWSAEAYAFYLILDWMDLKVSLPFAFSVYALSMLAGALSFLPGGLGGAEAVMVGLLLAAGVHEGPAVAATVIIRTTTLWFAVALGVAALFEARRMLPLLEASGRR